MLNKEKITNKALSSSQKSFKNERRGQGLGSNKNHSSFRTKTSLRMQYEAESNVILRELGSLEEVRKSLGLSRRKMSQLLLIDPSTWTRWVQNETKVPPFVLRSLQWYLALIDKKPLWHPQNIFHQSPSSVLMSERMKNLEQKVEKKLKSFDKDEKDRLGKPSFFSKILNYLKKLGKKKFQ